MFDTVDRMLRALLLPALPDGGDVTFDAPAASWSQRTTATPVLSAFLHHVAEDAEARMDGWFDRRDGSGRVVARQPAPRTYRACYLVTAWAADTGLEHAMLGAALAALADSDSVPAELTGGLGSAEFGVELTVADPALPRAPMDIWSALGIPPRAGLDVVVSTPLLPDLRTDLASRPERVDLAVQADVPPTPATEVPAAAPRRRVHEPS